MAGIYDFEMKTKFIMTERQTLNWPLLASEYVHLE